MLKLTEEGFPNKVSDHTTDSLYMDCGLWTYWVDSSIVVTVLPSSISENFNFNLKAVYLLFFLPV